MVTLRRANRPALLNAGRFAEWVKQSYFLLFFRVSSYCAKARPTVIKVGAQWPTKIPQRSACALESLFLRREIPQEI